MVKRVKRIKLWHKSDYIILYSVLRSDCNERTHWRNDSLSDQFDCDSLHLNVVTTDCTPIVSGVSADFSYVLSSHILISSHKSHNCSVY